MAATDINDTTDQGMLRSTLRDVLRRREGDAAWSALSAEMGLVALAAPEKVGGSGGSWADVAVVVEETGRLLAPVPYLSSAVAAGLLGRSGEPVALAALTALASGSACAAVAGRHRVNGMGGTLTGLVPNVLDGAHADYLIVPAGDDVYLVAASDARVTPLDPLDQTRGQAQVELVDSPATPIGVPAAEAEQLMRTMIAVESAVAAASCLDMTVDYLKVRQQFGRPLGAFQALRHRCADLAVDVSASRATAQAAVRAIQHPAREGEPSPAIVAALAKNFCCEVFLRVAAESIQLHGGIGFTWEHRAHRFLKRATTSRLLFGTPPELRRIVAAGVGLDV